MTSDNQRRGSKISFDKLTGFLNLFVTRKVNLQGSHGHKAVLRCPEIRAFTCVTRFAGRNRHFETAEGWNPTGLAQYLREGMGERVRDVLGGKLPDGDYEMIEIGARLFLNNAYVLLEQIGLMGNGNLSGLEQNDSVLSFVNYWSCLLTGCPFADD